MRRCGALINFVFYFTFCWDMQAIGPANSFFVAYRSLNRLASTASRQGRVAALAATQAFCLPQKRSFSSQQRTSFRQEMDGKGQGAWGAWNVEPAKFTRVVADSMKKLFVPTHLPCCPAISNMVILDIPKRLQTDHGTTLASWLATMRWLAPSNARQC